MIDEVETDAAAATEISRDMAALANRYADAWNSHDVGAIMALHADDTSYRMDGASDVQRGKAEVGDKFASQLAAIPALHFEVTALYGGSGHFVFESRITGMRTDGKVLNLLGIDLITVRDGLVVAKHSYAVPAR